MCILLLMVIPLMIAISWNTIIGSLQPCNFIHFPKKMVTWGERIVRFSSALFKWYISTGDRVINLHYQVKIEWSYPNPKNESSTNHWPPRWILTFYAWDTKVNLHWYSGYRQSTVDGRNPGNRLGCIKPCITWDICHANQCRILSLNGMMAIGNDIFEIVNWQRVLWIIFHKLFLRKSYDCLYVYYVSVIYLLSGCQMTGSTFSISYK